MRHRTRTRVSTGLFLLFFTFSAVVACFLLGVFSLLTRSDVSSTRNLKWDKKKICLVAILKVEIKELDQELIGKYRTISSNHWTNMVFVKQVLLHISRSWPIRVRFLHSWAELRYRTRPSKNKAIPYLLWGGFS